MLDDEQLVRALQELVDGRAHRALDQLDEVLRVEPEVGAEVERAAAALVVRSGTSSRMRATSASSKPASPSRSAAWSRTSPCAQGHALILIASTPTILRDAERDAAARPTSVTSSCVRSPVRGRALDRVTGGDLHLCAQRILALDDVAGDVLGQPLDEEHLADHELVDGFFEQLREARHVHALARRVEVDEAVDLGGDEASRPPCCIWTAFCTPVTPAREPELNLRDGGLHVNRARRPR